jgi:hypothetical protein
MLLVARKNLFSERIRLAISVGGVALSVFLLASCSHSCSWNEQVGVRRRFRNLWVASDGTTDFLAAASALQTPRVAAQARSRNRH